MAEIAAEFLPEGTFNVVLGDGETGALISSSKVPGLVAITGSVRAGMAVAAAAAKNLTRVHLELGGKAPCLVFDDADLDTAAAKLAESGFFNAGQDCTSSTRILVHDSVHGDFPAKLTEEEAVRMSNDVEYGLASSVWTTDHARALRMSRDLDFGCVWINCHIPLVAEMPHGGFKHSGYGKDLSKYGLEEYTRLKHVMSSIE